MVVERGVQTLAAGFELRQHQRRISLSALRKASYIMSSWPDLEKNFALFLLNEIRDWMAATAKINPSGLTNAS